jgi:hypothetical protein
VQRLGRIIMSLSEPLGSKKAVRRDRKEIVVLIALCQDHRECEKRFSARVVNTWSKLGEK